MAERSLTYVNRFTTPRFTLAHNFQERTVVTRTVAGWRAALLCENSRGSCAIISTLAAPKSSARARRVPSENCIANHSMEH